MIETLWQKLAQGGPLMVPIALLSLLAWALILERFFLIRRVIRSNRKALQRLTGAHPGPLPRGASAAALPGFAGKGPGAFQSAAEEVLLRQRALLGRRIGAIGRLASVAPLLGLLGTVSGMILTFQAITIHGSGNPRALAEGISQALVTTQAGLLTAIPILLAQRYLARMADRAEAVVRLCLDRAREQTLGKGFHD
jgi:biopolymer transport protein ExbB